MPQLLTPIQPVRIGPTGSPIAVCTKLGWSLQGPTTLTQDTVTEQQCLHLATAPSEELLRNVERLWQLDTLPYSAKVVTRSKQDQQALTLLQTATTRVDINGTLRYATPLLCRTPEITLHAPKEAVLPSLRSTERRIARDPKKVESYCNEIRKLEQAGYVAKISSDQADESAKSWFIPHHMVHHNGKDRIVFNCSYLYQGQSLNELLLPGPTLGPTMLGVLLRFRQHSVVVIGDIKSMFHQIRLLATDKPLLRFLWRDMKREQEPIIYEWQVLPFGTTCSPCCAIYALQRHIQEHGEQALPNDTVKQSFYVDNFLHSSCTVEEAKDLVDNLRKLLLDGGFEIRQWASNLPSVIEDLPPEARSASSELWLSRTSGDLQEPTLGLRWNCLSDTLGYKHRPVEPSEPTMRTMYKILASQYDPIGFIVPFTTRAKVLIQDLWKQDIGWDDPIHPQTLRDQWLRWEAELPNLLHLELPRPYTPVCADNPASTRQLHVFCDASERAYGSVAYLRTTDNAGQIHVSFVLARSRVAPKKHLSMPRLELCAALTGAQLARVLQTELTLPIEQVFLWSDSTTVLHWLRSDSCRYKVFVGTRVAEIQMLTEVTNWRYVDSARNSADDITRGLTLKELACPHRWTQGPDFLHRPSDEWPVMPTPSTETEESELRKSAFIGVVSMASKSQLPDSGQFDTWKDLVKAVVQSFHGAAPTDSSQSYDAADFIKAEKILLAQAQMDSFPDEVKALTSNQPVLPDSRIGSLSPEYDQDTSLIRVGGRLRHTEHLERDAIHPILLDPSHHITKLLIQEFDCKLHHPGPERVLAELRRQYWILRGWEAVRKHQHA
ncbi:uncharacterized protein [Misgurnus anguillicaudatus]|uniref:uncharacterized protein n=1 Tax=Misgurnus anguillicaudatus TaxID=75329 RepID=UPI003CCF2440